jgi:hypothetical protein
MIPDLMPILCRYIYKESSDKTGESNTKISSSHINTDINIPHKMDNAQQNKCVMNKQSHKPLRNKQNPVTITLCIPTTQVACKWNTNVQHSQTTSRMLDSVKLYV